MGLVNYQIIDWEEADMYPQTMEVTTLADELLPIADTVFNSILIIKNFLLTSFLQLIR